MTTDPQEIISPEGYGWYWPSTLDDDEWEVGGRNPREKPRTRLNPSDFDDVYGPVLARRKSPEPWTPKAGDRVRQVCDDAAASVLSVHGEWCWVLFDDPPLPITILTASLFPLDPKADQ